MILFLYGSDTYRSRQKLKEIIAHYRRTHKSGLSFHIFDVDNNDFGDFRNAVETTAMFEGKKLVVASNFLGSRDFSEKFSEWERKEDMKNTKDAICVFYEHDIHKDTLTFKWLAENAQSQEFNILKGARLNKWARGFVREKNIKIASRALSGLLAFTGGDLWAFENEINKLAFYAGGREISEKDLCVFLRPPEQTHIFSLVDAFIENNKSRAFRLLNAHIEAGDNANYLFFMIYNQLRNIAQVQEYLRREGGRISAAVNIEGMHPYVIRKSIGQARRFDKVRIKKIYNNFVDLDVAIKTGEVEPLSAIEGLIFEWQTS